MDTNRLDLRLSCRLISQNTGVAVSRTLPDKREDQDSAQAEFRNSYWGHVETKASTTDVGERRRWASRESCCPRAAHTRGGLATCPLKVSAVLQIKHCCLALLKVPSAPPIQCLPHLAQTTVTQLGALVAGTFARKSSVLSTISCQSRPTAPTAVTPGLQYYLGAQTVCLPSAHFYVS